MSKYRSDERRIQARRDMAVSRPELRMPTQPRRPPAGPTSFPLKRVDPKLQALLEEARGRGGRR